MEKEINDKIKDQGRGIDVSFWEEALDLLRPKMARTRLKELHSKKMKLRLEQIRAEQKKATETHEKEHNVVLPSASSSKATVPAQETIDEEKKPDLQTLEKKADETLKVCLRGWHKNFVNLKNWLIFHALRGRFHLFL